MQRSTIAVWVLAAIVATLGAGSTADHTTHRVIEMVRSIPWSEALLPFWNPPPMEAWAIRPMSVVLLKALMALPGTNGLSGIPSVGLVSSLAFLSLGIFGMASLAWLRRIRMAQVALPATLSCMLLSPTLFSAWLLTEFDTLAAGIILAGSTLLLQRSALGGRRYLAVGCVLFGLLLKESSGLVQLSFLFAGAIAFEFEHRTKQAKRHWTLWALGVGLWVILVFLTLGNKGSLVGRTNWTDRLPILEHNQAQLVYLTTIPGTVLVTLGALARPLHGTRLIRVLPWAGLALLLALPTTVFYSHFEAIYFSPRWVPSLLGTMLMVSVVGGLFTARAAGISTFPYLLILITILAFVAAILTAANPREDMASRLFLALTPILHGMAWTGLWTLWTETKQYKPEKVVVSLLALTMAWCPIATAWNTTVQWRQLRTVDFGARQTLVEQNLSSSKIIFNHFTSPIGLQELAALGWTADSQNPTTLVQTPAWLRKHTLPPMDWGMGFNDLELDYLTGTPLWIYWLADRSEMTPEANAALIGDLSWTRRPMGLFTPINHAHGESAPAQARRANLPEHNIAEDMRWTRFGSDDPTLLQLANERGGQWINSN